MNDFKVGDKVEDVNGNMGVICSVCSVWENSTLGIHFYHRGVHSDIPSFLVKKVQPKFEKGEKVLVESVISSGSIDAEGDIEVYLGGLHLFVPVATVRKLE